MNHQLIKIIVLFVSLASCKTQITQPHSATSNFIDTIKNEEHIANLITKLDSQYSKFIVSNPIQYKNSNCQQLSKSLELSPWYKSDFDNNGLTDIVLIGNDWYGYSVICILDHGEDYEVIPLSRNDNSYCSFPIVENNTIRYYIEDQLNPEDLNAPKKLKEISLIYKFGDFIEKNDSPKNHTIEKIEYATTACFGTCPVFSLIIHHDRSAMWVAEEHNNIDNQSHSGSYSATIDVSSHNDVVNLLNYTDFEKLQDNYSLQQTDQQTASIRITYDGGQVKSITDYGLSGTYALSRIHGMLFDLRKNQTWKK